MKIYRVKLGNYDNNLLLAENICDLLDRLHTIAEAADGKYPWDYESAERLINIECLGKAE